MDSAKRRISVLASGGIDSTTVVAFYLDRGYKVRCTHFEYGQENSESELESFDRICKHFRVSGEVLNLGFQPKSREHELLCRNALFVLAAASVNPNDDIALGIHAGPPYYDCTLRFMYDCQRLLDGYFGGTVRLHAPFLNYSKTAIAEFGASHNVPFQLTYSCEAQNAIPCGKCPSCLERTAAIGGTLLE